MSRVGQYLFTVLLGALATSVIGIILDKKSPVASMVRMICGLFLAITAISPIIDVQIPDLTNYFSSISVDSNAISDAGVELAASSQKAIITEQTTAYVLEKAKSLNLDITAQIVLNNDAVPVPEKIYLHGAAGPYAKRQLTTFIAEHLGIPEEYQIWN